MPAIDRNEIDHRLSYYAPDEDARAKHEAVRAAAKEFGYRLAELLPECREKSLAITSLEEAGFWANAAIARPAVPRG
jgi:hypothetical protein